MAHIADLIQACRVCCWQALCLLVPELKDLEGQLQHRSAGVDVAEHTRRMLVQCPKGDADVLLIACLLHDIGKPRTAAPNVEKGGWKFDGHGEEGAKMAGEILKRFDGHEKLRGQVCDLVRFHMEPHDGKVPVGFPWPAELIDLAELDSASFANRWVGKVRERFNKVRVKFNLPERPNPQPEKASTALEEYFRIYPEATSGPPKA